jgi:hypothetical protein
VVWFALTGAALGQDSPPEPPATADLDQGEYVRLSAEIGSLASKNAWVGVERTFQRLLATGVPPAFEDWVWGAQAARASGDIATARERFRAAAAIREDRSVVDTLWDIDSRFGSVVLYCDPGSFIELVPEQVPFDPDLMRATEFARARVHESCAFDGLLPAGRYRLLHSELVVVPRSDLRVDLRGIRIDRRTRKQLKESWMATEAPVEAP